MRDKRSAVTLCFLVYVLHENGYCMYSVDNNKRINKRLIDLSFVVSLFMIWTTALLLHINMTFLSLILLHQMSIAMTMGESSYTAI